MRPGRSEEARVEDAIGIEEEHEVALGLGQAGVHRRRVGSPSLQVDPSGPVGGGDLRRRIGARVVDHQHRRVGLSRRRRQRVLERRPLVDAQEHDRRPRGLGHGWAAYGSARRRRVARRSAGTGARTIPHRQEIRRRGAGEPERAGVP